MIVFVGAMYLGDEWEWFTKYAKTALAISSDTHQKAIWAGLSEYDDIFIVNRPPCGYFPKKFSKIRIKAKKGHSFFSIGWLNILIVRDIQYVFSTWKALWRLCRNENVYAIIGYMPFLPRIIPLILNKLLFREIPLSIIVPDLPQHSYPKNRFSKMMRWIRQIEGTLVNRLSKYVDSYIYLTEEMHNVIGQDCAYIVQEAIYTPVEKMPLKDFLADKFEDHFTYLYCGKVNQENGIDRLIVAFMNLEYQDIRLMICGTGELLKKMQEITSGDERIIFTGQLDHENVIALEQHATVLVNPRYTDGENTAYSFPSKLIEYLASGRPVISSRLEGIPRDYDPHLLYIRDNSVKAVEKALRYAYAVDRDELDTIGKRGREFVERNKSSKVQGRKLYEHLTQIHDVLKGYI